MGNLHVKFYYNSFRGSGGDVFKEKHYRWKDAQWTDVRQTKTDHSSSPCKSKKIKHFVYNSTENLLHKNNDQV